MYFTDRLRGIHYYYYCCRFQNGSRFNLSALHCAQFAHRVTHENNMREHYHFNGPHAHWLGLATPSPHTTCHQKCFAVSFNAAFPFPQNTRASLWCDAFRPCVCCIECTCSPAFVRTYSAECSNLLEIKLSILTCTRFLCSLPCTQCFVGRCADERFVCSKINSMVEHESAHNAFHIQ